MARITKTLTATEIKNAKPKEKKYKLSDGRGLFLEIRPNAGKYWKLKYKFNNKDCEYSIGVYPTITLAKARQKREELKTLITDGTDPSQIKKDKKVIIKQDEIKKENTFYNVSQKWLKSYESQVSENTHIRLARSLKNYVYPTIKDKAIDEVKRLEVIAIMEVLKDKDLLETARRTKTLLNKIFKYAVTHELTSHNIIADIDTKDILGKKVKKHYPTITKDKEVKALLQAIEEFKGSYTTKMALKILPYVFVRSHNIRHMEWVEIDLKAKEWTMPKEKMKTKEEFILPLPHQVITLLQELKDNSTSSKYVFPSPMYNDRPLSDNTLVSAIRRMGYSKDEFVPHSFRSMFSTIANEKANTPDGHKYTSEVIEACLAHKEPNKIKEAYNRSNYKEAMKGLVSWYADYLEGLK